MDILYMYMWFGLSSRKLLLESVLHKLHCELRCASQALAPSSPLEVWEVGSETFRLRIFSCL